MKLLSSLTLLILPLLTTAQTTTEAILVPPPFSTNPAEWTSIYNSLVSEGRIPSTLTAPPPWATGEWGPGYGPWYKGPGGPGKGPWGPGHPHGPGGPGGPPWGPWASEWSTLTAWPSTWSAAPWTNWWAGTACPGSDWPGWTVGPWSTNPPWTSWAGCTAKTSVVSVVSPTVSGGVASTVVGVQVAAAEGTSSGGGVEAATASSTGGAVRRTGVPVAVVGAAAAVWGVVGGL